MNERLDALRRVMKENAIDLYLIPTDDFHGSEYVGNYFKCREYVTGFTGSAGVAVVTQEDARLWTDGRYFLQAEAQLRDSGFSLMKSGEEGVPTIAKYIEDTLGEGETAGADGRVINAAFGKKLTEIAEKKHGKIDTSKDLVGEIWKDRPAMSKERSWILTEEYSGESAVSKLGRIREEMKKKKADIFLLTSLEDIAWTLNLRGNDVLHCPVTLSFLAVTEKGCIYYVNEETLSDEVRAYLEKTGVSVSPYDSVYEMARALGEKSSVTVLLDPAKMNDRLYRLLGDVKKVEETSPTVLMKSIKNETELKNIRIAHLRDGVAMVKWIYWLKNAVGKEELTELSVSEKLAGFRASMKNFLDLSFETIAGYKEHGAIIHYAPTEESDAELKPESFLLVDSGGHYLEGSTDITRTIALGELTEEEKEVFTLVLKAHLALLPLVFHYGCSGVNFDLLVREPLWRRGLDYRHGTGHGVGYLLAVHEMPNGFRYKVVPERVDSSVFEEGMVTTDEPGLYLEGKFGVRTESELICRVKEETEYGKFMYFENVTFCPIDLDAVIPEMLTEEEKQSLNDYHETVRKRLSPYLNEEENEWLTYATRRIQ